jgi:hypothetical protein
MSHGENDAYFMELKSASPKYMTNKIKGLIWCMYNWLLESVERDKIFMVIFITLKGRTRQIP